jgi:hypothetical protein
LCTVAACTAAKPSAPGRHKMQRNRAPAGCSLEEHSDGLEIDLVKLLLGSLAITPNGPFFANLYITKPGRFRGRSAGPRQPSTREPFDSPSSPCPASDCESVRILTGLTAHPGARTKHELTRAPPSPSGEPAVVALLCLPSNQRRRRSASSLWACGDARPPPLAEWVVAALSMPATPPPRPPSRLMQLSNVEALERRLGDGEVIP